MFIALYGHLSYFIKDFHEFLIILAVSTILFIFAFPAIFRSNLKNRNKMLLLSLLFTLLSIVYIYSFFEAYFRYRFDQSDSLGFLNVTEHWYQRHVLYNNYQYRDKNFSIKKSSGTVRIGVMGDSVAWGYGIKNVDNRFSNLLEKKLRDHGYHVEIYNFSTPGYDTYQETEEYNNKDYKFNIDILLWSYFPNDAEPPANNAGSRILTNANAQIPAIVKFLSTHSFFFDYIYWRLSAKYATTFTQLRNADLEQYEIPSVFAYHKKLISNFTSQLESQNKKIVVIMFPFIQFLVPYGNSGIDQKMHTVFTRDGVTTIVDMYPYLKGKNPSDLEVNRFDSHPNESVHKLAAEKLYDAIVPLLEKTKDGTIIKH